MLRFVVDKNIPLGRQAFEHLGEVSMIETGKLTSAVVRDADALIVRSETTVGRELLEGSRVQFVGTATIGTDHVDLEYLRSRNVAFASAPGCNANSVKEYIVAALLCLSGKEKIDFKGRTLGVVGVGNVGSKVVTAARALGLSVIENDPPLARATGEHRFVPLDDLMQCDIITLHVPLTKAGPDPTYHLFNRDRFRKMKPGSIFINTSRGGVVETSALREAIRDRRISHSIIDVWENEPGIDLDLLAEVTVGTAHIAGYSLEGKVNGLKMIREVACKYFGQRSSWDPYTLLGPPPVPQAVVPDDHPGSDEIPDLVVKQCYDIMLDDRMLRNVLTMPPGERSDYFTRLRADYRVRREFSTVTVCLPRKYGSVRETLVGIGFTNVNLE